MGAYLVEVSPQAQKDILELAKAEAKKVVKVLEALQSNPRPRGVEKLRENPSFWRVCLGRNYRIVYLIDDHERLVIVALVRNRNEVYRQLRELDKAKLMSQLQPLFDQKRLSATAQ